MRLKRSRRPATAKRRRQKRLDEGIQRIAVGTQANYEATDRLAECGLEFMPGLKQQAGGSRAIPHGKDD
jgi:4-hydroxyphenylpyruvate dioxygenase